MTAADIVALDGAPIAGCMTWWSLTAADYQNLVAAWGAAGFDPADLPSLPSPQVALRRAVRRRRSDGYVIKRVKAGGYVVKAVFDTDDGYDKDWATECHVGLDERGWLICAPADSPLAADIRVDYQAALQELTAGDIRDQVLLPILGRLDSVALRPETGGVYYVPPQHAGEWKAVAAAIAAAGAGTIYTPGAVSVRDIAPAVLDGITAEATAEAARLRKAVLDDDLGARALRSRQAEAQDLAAKLGRYEALLGTSLGVLRAQVASVQADLARAVLAPDDDTAADVAAMIDALA